MIMTKKTISEFAYITFAMFIISCSIYFFLIPSGIVVGSISGLSMVIMTQAKYLAIKGLTWQAPVFICREKSRNPKRSGRIFRCMEPLSACLRGHKRGAAPGYCFFRRPEVFSFFSAAGFCFPSLNLSAKAKMVFAYTELLLYRFKTRTRSERSRDSSQPCALR